MKVVIVSGGFDPLHSGHISHFEAARGLGDKLIIALNSDSWLTRKKVEHLCLGKKEQQSLTHWHVLMQLLILMILMEARYIA